MTPLSGIPMGLSLLPTGFVSFHSCYLVTSYSYFFPYYMMVIVFNNVFIELIWGLRWGYLPQRGFTFVSGPQAIITSIQFKDDSEMVLVLPGPVSGPPTPRTHNLSKVIASTPNLGKSWCPISPSLEKNGPKCWAHLLGLTLFLTLARSIFSTLLVIQCLKADIFIFSPVFLIVLRDINSPNYPIHHN